jgi:hypothetical protein
LPQGHFSRARNEELTVTAYLYEASVPVFQRYLARLIGLVDAAQADATDQGVDDALLLNARLAACRTQRFKNSNTPNIA